MIKFLYYALLGLLLISTSNSAQANCLAEIKGNLLKAGVAPALVREVGNLVFIRDKLSNKEVIQSAVSGRILYTVPDYRTVVGTLRAGAGQYVLITKEDSGLVARNLVEQVSKEISLVAPKKTSANSESVVSETVQVGSARVHIPHVRNLYRGYLERAEGKTPEERYDYAPLEGEAPNRLSPYDMPTRTGRDVDLSTNNYPRSADPLSAHDYYPER